MQHSFTRRSLAILGVLLGAAAALVAVALAVTVGRGKSAEYVFKDLAYLCGREKLGGMAAAISNIGILLWAGAAAMALLTAAVLLRLDRSSRPGRFLVVLGLVTVAVALDDFFMLHETVLPYLGVPQKVYPIAYATVLAAALWLFRDVWPRWSASLLIGSLVLLGLSVVMDAVADTLLIEASAETAFEDSLKFFGIVLWTAYVARFAAHWLAPAPVAAPARESVDA